MGKDIIEKSEIFSKIQSTHAHYMFDFENLEVYKKAKELNKEILKFLAGGGIEFFSVRGGFASGITKPPKSPSKISARTLPKTKEKLS